MEGSDKIFYAHMLEGFASSSFVCLFSPDAQDTFLGWRLQVSHRTCGSALAERGCKNPLWKVHFIQNGPRMC